MSERLDPKTTALVLIDLEHAIVGRESAPRSGMEVVANAARLAAAFRERGGTVAYVRVLLDQVLKLPVDKARPSGDLSPGATEIVPEAGLQAGDLVVVKRQWGAFYGTDLEQQLRRRKVETIVIGGIATNMGVESTARAAFDRGFALVFAEDAMTSVAAEMHRFAVENVFPLMGRVRKVDEVVGMLEA